MTDVLWAQSTYRYRATGARNPATLGKTWHAYADIDLDRCRESNSRFTRLPAVTLCGIPYAHMADWAFRQKPPARGPLGGRVAVCANCRRRTGAQA